MGQYRLLILDGHNSHCTFTFCKYAADNKIIIICLPSHTTHALQPCDVGAFGPLAQSWKREVTLASQSLIAIRKDNLLAYYHAARVTALKTATIQSAFRKTGIWPLDRHAIPLSAFELSKTTTTQASQPLPARLPSILVPTPNPTPAPTPTPSAAAITTLQRDAAMPETTPVEESSDDNEEPMERYHIEVPPPLPGTASRQSLRAENTMLRDIIVQAGIALEEDYAQMKLMDLENERLRKRAFEKEKRKAQNKRSSGQARHMTAAENLDLLARQDWESRMKDVFKEAAPQFRVLKKSILDYHKQIEKAKQVAGREAKKAEREAKKAAAVAEKAARARGRVRGNRGGGRGRGRGRGRGTKGRDTGGASTEIDGSDSGLESSGTPESSESSSDSDSESEAEVLIPRSRRQRPVWVIQGRSEEVAAQERNQHTQPRPQPRPLQRMCPPLLETGDNQAAEISSVAGAVVGGQNEPEVLQEDAREQAASPKSCTDVVPRVMEDDLEAEGGSLEARLPTKSTEIETWVDPPRRRNPRRK